MRYLSLHLPFLATDRIRRRLAQHEEVPPATPIATMAKVKTAVRLVALDRHARALGLKPGAALADARAMYPSLSVHAADPDGDAATRDALVDWCRLFTPLAAVDGEISEGQAGAMLDISGVAHLFGGEIKLMDNLVGRLAHQGFTAHVAIAATPGAAWALARYGHGHPLIEDGIGAAEYAKIFAPMPLGALRLDATTILQLGQAGLRRVGDLLLRPRAPIAARFGSHIHHRLDILIGRAKDPISPRFEAPAFVAERRFAEGILNRKSIEATILALAQDLCGLLARHGEGARRLEVSLYRVDGVVKHIAAGTSRPLRDPAAMARLFHERIEVAGEEGLDTGYGFDVVRLAALAAERLDPAQPRWDETDANESAFADLIDRLGARFGSRVTRLGVADAHRPERATTARPVSDKPQQQPARATAHGQDTQALPERPIRLFDRPEPIDTIAAVPDGPPVRFRWRRVMHQVTAVEGPERIGPEWWRQGPGEDGMNATRDYFRAENTEGHRFWLYREGLYSETLEPRWFLHGLFA